MHLLSIPPYGELIDLSAQETEEVLIGSTGPRPELIIHKISPIILFEYSWQLSPLFYINNLLFTKYFRHETIVARPWDLLFPLGGGL